MPATTVATRTEATDKLLRYFLGQDLRDAGANKIMRQLVEGLVAMYFAGQMPNMRQHEAFPLSYAETGLLDYNRFAARLIEALYSTATTATEEGA